MAKIKVDFKRSHSAGLQASRIYVNGVFVPFTNHRASKMLEAGVDFDLYWRIVGNPGSSLSVDYTARGVTQPAVTASTIPPGKSRLSDFTVITL